MSNMQVGFSGLSSQDIKEMKDLASKQKGKITDKQVAEVFAKDGVIDVDEKAYLEGLRDKSDGIKPHGTAEEFEVNVEFKLPGDPVDTAQKAADKVAKTTGNVRNLGVTTLEDAEHILKVRGSGDNRSLMSDATLLEKKGLLSEDEKTFLSDLSKKINASFAGVDSLSKAEIATLKSIIENAIKTLSGDQPEVLNFHAEDFKTFDGVMDKSDAVMQSADAAIHGARISTAASGRSVPDMQRSIGELSQHIDIIRNAIPQLKDKLSELEGEINKKTEELKAQGKNPDDDETIGKLKAQALMARNTLESLSGKLSELSDVKMQTLEKCKGVATVDAEMHTRIAGYEQMSQKLSEGAKKLEGLQKQVSLLKGSPAGEAIKQQMESIRSDMEKSMNELITKFNSSSSTLGPKVKQQISELLDQQLRTLHELKLNDPQIMSAVTNIRHNILGGINKFGVKDIDDREKKSINDLDKKIDGFVAAHLNTATELNAKVAELKKLEAAAKKEGKEIGKEKDETDKLLEGLDEAIGYGTNITFSSSQTVGFGGSTGMIRASLTGGLGFTLKVGKSVDAMAPYQVGVDLNAVINGNFTVGHLFELDATLKGVLGGGLAFKSLEDAKEFVKKFKETIQIALDTLKAAGQSVSEGEISILLNKSSTLKHAMGELGKTIVEHGFVRAGVEASAEAESHAFKSGAGVKGEKYYYSYGNGAKTENSASTWKVEVAGFGLEFGSQSSKVTSPPTNGEKMKYQKIDRTSVHIILPPKAASLLAAGAGAGIVALMGQEGANKLAEELKRTNPALAGMTLSSILWIVDTHVAAIKPDVIKHALEHIPQNGPGHTTAGVFLGLEVVNTVDAQGHPHTHFGVEIGGEMQYKKSATIPIAPGFVAKTDTKLSMEVAIVVNGSSIPASGHGEGNKTEGNVVEGHGTVETHEATGPPKH